MVRVALLTQVKDVDNMLENKIDIELVYQLAPGEDVFREEYIERILQEEPKAILINRYMDGSDDVN